MATVLVPSNPAYASITSYAGLLSALMRLIDGDDTASSSIPVATLGQIIALGEKRLYREVFSRWNEVDWGLIVNDNTAELPADFQRASIVHFGGRPLEPVSEEVILERNEVNSGGTARYFAHAGNALVFSPAVADGTELLGRYFCSLPALSAETLAGNALFAACEDLFVYASLAESAPFFGQDARIPLWTAKYLAILEQINQSHQRAGYSVGRMRVRPSSRLIG